MYLLKSTAVGTKHKHVFHFLCISAHGLIGPTKGYFPTPDIAYFVSPTSDTGVKNWHPTFKNQPDTRHSTFDSTLETLISKSLQRIAKILTRHPTFLAPFLGPTYPIYSARTKIRSKLSQNSLEYRYITTIRNPIFFTKNVYVVVFVRMKVRPGIPLTSLEGAWISIKTDFGWKSSTAHKY